MKIAVIGLGSMGKRRIRLIQKICNDAEVIGIDTNPERRSFCEKEYHIKSYSEINEIFTGAKPDCAFVCTSPLSHNSIINQCLQKGIHVFTELNLVSNGYEENMTLAKQNGAVLFLSSTALYRKEMQYIIEKTQSDKTPFCYNYHIGQYLPDWHPWENYNDFFIGDKRTNGCREILAIEMPWIISAFGEISDLNVISGKATSLNIDYNDYYMIQLIHKNGCKGSLIVDVICREAVRKLEVFNENNYIEWQGRPDSLKSKNVNTRNLETIHLYDQIDKLADYSNTIIENQYSDEIIAFFDVLKGMKKPRYTFKDDLYTLKLIDRIEGRM